MTNRNESVHERLNRELWRMRFRNPRNWLSALGILALLVLTFVIYVRIPGEIAYQTGTMEDVAQLMTEAGPLQVLSVRIDDRIFHVRTRAAILHLARGDAVCVQLTTFRLTGYGDFGRSAPLCGRRALTLRFFSS